MREKARLGLYTLVAQAPIPVQKSIRQRALEAMQKGEQRYSRETIRNVDMPVNCETGGGRTQTSESQASSLEGVGLPNDSFMRVPSKEVVDAAIAQFID